MSGVGGMLDTLIVTAALSAGVAWASGLRLYLVLFLLGLSGRLELLPLPAGLEILQHPAVLIVSGVLVLIEFVADKIPGFDSLWDSFQTFVRIPAGGALSAMALGLSVDEPAAFMVVALLGGTLTAGTALSKAGSRLAINTSPEPFSNWGASLTEDVAVLGGFWLMLQHPVVFIGCLLLFLLLVAFLLPRLWRFVRKAIRGMAAFVRGESGV